MLKIRIWPIGAVVRFPCVAPGADEDGAHSSLAVVKASLSKTGVAVVFNFRV